MGTILRGKPVAEAIETALLPRIAALEDKGVPPCLALLRVGEAPGALSYERAVARRCQALGIRMEKRVLPETSDTAAVLAAVDAINGQQRIHGCLILRPLPEGVDEGAVCERLAPEKDVDGVTYRSLGMVFTGKGSGHRPCTAEACMRMLRFYGVELSGRRVTLVGRSLVVGRPLSMLLTAADATVTLCHRRTRELPRLCREAEILISAAGSPKLIDESYVNPNQVILDVGTSMTPEGGLCGDVDFDRVLPVTAALSPVPGGVGAVTSAILLEHVVRAAEKAAARSEQA